MARVLTGLQTPAGRTRRAAGLGAASAGAALLAAGWAWAGAGLGQMAAGALATALAVFSVSRLGQALRHQRQARREEWLFAGLALNLPYDWYLVADLHLPSMAGERLPVWAVVVAPGGLVVIQVCSEQGQFFPAGPVWMVKRGRSARVVPSPTGECGRAAAAVREVLCLGPEVPVWPLVVLTDPHGVYHPVRSDALVIGAPHLPETVLRCVQHRVLRSPQGLRLAAELARFHG